MSNARLEPKLGCLAARLESVAPAHLNVIANAPDEYVRR
jgi:hypothetical protein